MLVLARKQGEVIRIGDDIRVMVVSTGRQQVKLGITAPEHVVILREEIAGESSPAGERRKRNALDAEGDGH